ncbi:peptidase c19 ubiquitin carboxyl-terminal hydrolase 2 [Diplodia corticola]|uniref:ubiquitinyl hydrolase 1 n=1 Tax=Diplodia corticola TaxID=236234 RepID=A0A1J9RUM3_9PEZI|nr:peptidase c19 ubiquitin carboxyl-terminal hydrolase 2 [Diplodia corticola]OJD31205.1 peptidase c19 ubiquitin carboxyl-terminal hydrolase 2 [Diplodia corticola]
MSNFRPPPQQKAHDDFAVWHDAYYEDPRTTPASILVLVVLGFIALHRVLGRYEIPLRAIPELFWNCFVYAMPAALVFAMGRPSLDLADNADTSSSEDKERKNANLFAAKNEVLRRTFGLDGNGLLKAFSGDRALRAAGALAGGMRNAAPPGLGNWDNSCYQNSVIQGLASLPSLESFLTEAIGMFDGLTSDSTNGTLLDTVLKLNNPDNNGRQLWTPAKLKSMSSWQQQDAQEYFSKVLDEIDKEILKAVKQSRKIAGFEEVPSVEEERKAEPVKYPESLRNPLEGLLAQRVGCMNCGFTEGLSMIPFNCLTVPLQSSFGYACDIRECLNEYTKLEPIEGVECAKCTLLRTRDALERVLQDRDETVPTEATKAMEARLKLVRETLEDEELVDSTIIKKCSIPRKNWVSSTKSRQAVVGRPPKSLVIHVNRSVFDELTGAQRKNHASVSFPEHLDLGPWALGSSKYDSKDFSIAPESWSTNPAESMISPQKTLGIQALPYELRAVVAHYGRHENGHYICYRKHPFTADQVDGANTEQKESEGSKEETEGETFKEETEDEESKEKPEVWWRLSDEDVSQVSKETVLAQGGVFMLFYEAKELPSPPSPSQSPLMRRSSTATIRAVAPMSTTVETYEPVQEQEDEGSVEEMEVADEKSAHREFFPIGESHFDGEAIPPRTSYHRPTESMETTPPKSDSESDYEPISPASYNSGLEDTVVLPFKKHNRDRNSTISNASSASFNYPPTPLSPLSLSPTISEQPTPFAEHRPAFPNPIFTRQDMDSDSELQPLASPALFSPHSLATPTSQSPNLDPITRAAIEASVQEEEDEPRWTTSRSDYAPSTVGGTDSEYAPSAGGYPSDVEGSAYGSEAGDGPFSEKEPSVSGSPVRMKKEPQPHPHRQSLTMRTAQAQKAEGESEEQVGLEQNKQNLRMVAAS